MGKKKNKMKNIENEASKKENEIAAENESKSEMTKMRSSAEIEDEDNVVHDEESPRHQVTVPDEVEFTEITNLPKVAATLE